MSIIASFKSLLMYQAVLIVLLISCDIPVAYFTNSLLKALSDNAGHALISVVLWFACTRPFREERLGEVQMDAVLNWVRIRISTYFGIILPIAIVEIALAMFCASLLDVDHFIESRSASLFGATHLLQRPRGHSIFFILLIAVSF